MSKADPEVTPQSERVFWPLDPSSRASATGYFAMASTSESTFEDRVQQLQNMMGDSKSPEVIRKVLKKYNGDIEKAVDALFSGETGVEEDEIPPLEPVPIVQMDDIQPDNRIIDLTKDDDNDMKRAIEMSMQTNNVRFGPTERDPHPDWQMTISNV